MQGRLSPGSSPFQVVTECACCGRSLRFEMRDDLGYTLEEPAARPLFFVPLVDFGRLRRRGVPSIVDDF